MNNVARGPLIIVVCAFIYGMIATVRTIGDTYERVIDLLVIPPRVWWLPGIVGSVLSAAIMWILVRATRKERAIVRRIVALIIYSLPAFAAGVFVALFLGFMNVFKIEHPGNIAISAITWLSGALGGLISMKSIPEYKDFEKKSPS